MIMAGGTVRAERVSATRESILVAAERLFAEHGVVAVSNRQIGEAAGQGNNTAVSYHFGTKIDLVRAIARRHNDKIEHIRADLVTEVDSATDLRGWVVCLVRPSTQHLADLGSPTWFGRFAAQVMTDPVLRATMVGESLTSPSLRRIVAGIDECLPDLPAPVRAERDDMARHLIVQVTAERERALAEGSPTPRTNWHDAATGLVDAIVGLLLAPTT
jgi:AcrR family transcriptional regulator